MAKDTNAGPKRTLFGHFRRFFLRGLAVALPTMLTLWLLLWGYGLFNRNIGEPINRGVLWVVNRTPLRDSITEDVWRTYFAWWFSILLALLALYLFGRFVASYFGRALWRLVETTLIRIPLIKQVYPNVKQVTDFVFGDQKMQFSGVVAVEYPRRGVWSLGLVTASAMRTIAEDSGGAEMITIFIPSSPTPVTGYTITVRKDETLLLPITIDEALRFTISGGVLLPKGEQPLSLAGMVPSAPAGHGNKPPGLLARLASRKGTDSHDDEETAQ